MRSPTGPPKIFVIRFAVVHKQMRSVETVERETAPCMVGIAVSPIISHAPK